MSNRFDQEAATWDENPAHVALSAALWNALSAAVDFDPSWRALEVGCGTGLLTIPLAREVGSVLAVDQSPGMLDVLQQKCVRHGLNQIEVKQLDLTDPEARKGVAGPFSVVITAMTLHHLRDVPVMLDFFNQVLHPGCRLCIMDLDEEHGTFHPDGVEVPHHGFARDSLREMLLAAGFGDIIFSTAHKLTKQDATGIAYTYPVFLAIASRGFH